MRARVPLSRLHGLLPPGALGAHRRLAVAAVAAALLAAAASLAVPLLAGPALDRGWAGRGPADAARLLLPAATAWLAATMLGLVRNVLAQRLGHRVVTALRGRVVAHALALPVASLDALRTGELTARLAADGEQLRRAMADDLVRGAGDAALVLGGGVLLCAIDWRLTALLAALALAAPLAHRALSPRLRALHREALEAGSAAMSRIGEALAGVRMVKSFGREAHEAALAARRLGRARDAAMRAGAFESLVWSGALLAAGLAGAGVLAWGLHEAAAGRLSAGALVAYLYTLALVAVPLASLAGIAGRADRAHAAAARLAEILDRPAECADEPADVPSLVVGAGRVDFDDVHFAYEGGPPVLAGFSLQLPAGRTTALVGATGAGKSTVVALLQRFHEPQAGSIRIDGVSIASVGRASLRRACAVVPQQPLLFDGSIADNIGYGRLDASEDKLRRAAAAAHVDEFADRLPGGLASPVGERGVRLSGGQAQRVAIARALLRDAPILLLDEATSSLDPSSEALVHDALRTLAAGRTTLVIAHRLATVERADRVALLEGGRIVALGTHDELRATSARYARLFYPDEPRRAANDGGA